MAAAGECGKYEQPLWTSVVSGTIGGGVGVIVGYPFESVKVRMQTGRRARLFGSLFSGVSAPLLAVTPQWALMYSMYFAAQSFLDYDGPEAARGALSGALCGLATASITAPVDAIKIQAQNEKLSASTVVRRLVATGGARALGHGMLATCVHLVLSQAVFFAVYEHVLGRLDKKKKNKTTSGWFDWRPAGGAAGLVEWTTCMTTDTVKTRLQAGPLGTRYVDAWAATYRDGGLRCFYRGYVPMLCRAIPVNASAYFVIELVNSTLLRWRVAS
ncbi:hypothetical protein CTAYLR_004899 [Chrysophaeum taylorii]|uniref:Mitochondrial carrier protein n=1 Tax=Chrysophaeum taylorii TaxID=2483200 RepID=A0AAD7XND1_9STRA|nr:hypothetical protein CTAYLR_004899 [Chrysophaeum taylorii]